MTPTRTAPDPPGGAAGAPARPSAPRRRPVRGPDARRLAGHAARLWGLLTLGGIVVLAALVIWHLARRGRLVRERLGPPRNVRLPDLGPAPTDAPEPDRPRS